MLFFISEMTDIKKGLASQKKRKEKNIYHLHFKLTKFTDQTLNFFDIFSGSFLTTISIHLLAL